MPWTAAEAARHQSGLTAHQRTVWARVANSVLRSCQSSGGSTAECEGKAVRQANAVAKRAPAKSIKLADDGSLSILAIPFSGPIDFGDGKGRDSDGEFFTERTDLCLDWFPTHRPLLYHHGLDDDLQVAPIGKVDVGSAEKDEAGWWLRAQVDRSNRYWADIAALIDDDRMYASSGAMPHLVKRNKDGEITRWPWVELSLTTSPANLFATVAPAEAAKHYKAAGMTPPPTIDEADARTWAELLDTLGDDVAEFAAGTRRYASMRAKVGRPLSEARRRRLTALAERMRESASEVDAMLAETAAPEPPGADVEAGADAPHAPDAAPEEKAVAAAPPATPAPEPTPSVADGASGELTAIFAEFQKARAYYAPVLTPAPRR